MTLLQSVPVLIIGGGPAGLCSSDLLDKYGVDHILCESGNSAQNRSHYDSQHITHGIGGAGLYSDGKFSFYPSSTKLWELQDITPSFNDIMDILNQYGIDRNKAIKSCEKQQENKLNDKDALKLKLYPSLYLDFKTRQKMINDFESNLNGYILNNTTVTNIICNEITMKYQIFINYDNTKYIETDYIIFAGGRYFPIFLNRYFNGNKDSHYLGDDIFQRYEFGVRIEMDNTNIFWDGFGYNGYNDPKYKFIDDNNENIEFRTFCYCKRGLVVKTNTFGINTFSGRADCKPTNQSNFGFNARIYSKDNDEDDGYLKVIENEINHWSMNDITFYENLRIGDDNDIRIVGQVLKDKMGQETGEIMCRGLRRLSTYFTALQRTNIRLYGPTLEGVGMYPMLNALQWKSRNKLMKNRLFVAGDCTGIFRGIVASMTSGNYAARQILKCMQKIRPIL